MSTVGSITSAQDPLYLQSVQGQDAQRNGRQAFGARLDTAAQNAGLDSSQVSQLHTDIQAAIKSAMQNGASNNQSPGAVKDAVDGVLKKYGIDPAGIKPPGGGRVHHHHHGAGQAQKAQGTDDGDTDDPTQATNATDQAVATMLHGLPSGSLVDAAA